MQIWHCSIYQRIYWVFALTMLLCFTVVSFNRSLNIYDLKKKKVGHIDLKSFKELCTPMEHMPGRWVAQPDLGIRFPCCGYYTNDSAEECQQKDTYLREDGFQYGDNELYAVIGGNGCRCGSNMVTAKWIPKKCHLFKWSKEAFCQQLNGRTILFIGDSTMQQSAATVMNAVHGTCADSISYALSDTLLGLDFGVMNRGVTWGKAVAQINPDLVVLTVGAHVNDTQSFEYILGQVLNGTSLYPEKKVIWKTQNPGGCSMDMQDFLDPESGNKPSQFDPLEYHHQDFYSRDKLAIEFFNGTDVSILDMRPLYLRTDAHPGSCPIETTVTDCLHFCSSANGPMHLLPILLHHLL